MNPHQIDAAYRPFPPFSEWAGLRIDDQRWQETVDLLPAPGTVAREQLAQAHGIAMRAAAVDTGAIEGLYEVDRGFTMTIALQMGAWETVLEQRGERVRSLIASQMHAYEYVMDLATGREPITEMWIRTLHERICESQDTYQVLTEVGFQNQPLPRGQYKIMPNHVRLPDGSYHAYAPVDMVPVEMHRLVEELRSNAFVAAHPVLQAAYAHYALVSIHPFADGNGRVARALASVFTYRSHSVPLLILVEHKPAYFAALQSADRGDPQPFADFVFERTVDAMLLVEQTLAAAAEPDPDAEIENLRSLLRVTVPYTDSDVEHGGRNLLSAFLAEIDRQVSTMDLLDRLTITSTPRGTPGWTESWSLRQNYRFSPDEDGAVVNALVDQPFSLQFTRTYNLQLPSSPDGHDPILLVDSARNVVVFSARIGEVFPEPTTMVRLRLGIAVRRVLGELLAAVRQRVSASP